MKVVIQAVPWDKARRTNANALAAATGGRVVWDEDRSGYATFLRVLDAIGDDAAWVLEDDVDLCADWTTRAAEVVAAHPGMVIRAFSLGPLTGPVPGLGFYSMACTFLPTGVARAIREFARTLPLRVRRSEALDQLHDHLVGLWLDAQGLDYWLHTPSLVQHRIGPSLIDPRGRGLDRQSPTFRP